MKWLVEKHTTVISYLKLEGYSLAIFFQSSSYSRASVFATPKNSQASPRYAWKADATRTQAGQNYALTWDSSSCAFIIYIYPHVTCSGRGILHKEPGGFKVGVSKKKTEKRTIFQHSRVDSFIRVPKCTQWQWPTALSTPLHQIKHITYPVAIRSFLIHSYKETKWGSSYVLTSLWTIYKAQHQSQYQP